MKKTTGYILNGVYYREEPNLDELKNDVSAMHKQYDHDRQRENHRYDLIQPWKDGQLNPEFIEHYPEEDVNRYRSI